MKTMAFHQERMETAKDYQATHSLQQRLKMLNHSLRTMFLTLPGRIPGYKSNDIKLLSASKTKMSMWRDFVAACTASEKQAVSYSKFKELWEQFHPNVVVAKPMTDLCVTCQQNTSKLVRSVNLPDGEKSECMRAQQEHLDTIKSERELCNKVCEEAKNTFEAVEPPI